MVNPLQDPGNLTSFIQQLQFINSMTDVGWGGVLGSGMLMVIFAVLFMIQKAFSYEKSFVTTALITGFVGIIFRILGLVNDFVLYLCIAGIIFSFYFLYKESQEV